MEILMQRRDEAPAFFHKRITKKGKERRRSNAVMKGSLLPAMSTGEMEKGGGVFKSR